MPAQRRISRLGLGLGLLYLVVTASIIIYGLTCQTSFCQLALVIPVVPWVTFFEGLPYTPLWYPLAVLLNTILMYWAGRTAGRLYASHKEKRALESY